MIVSIVSVVLMSQGVGSIELHKILFFAVVTNFILFFFNLLPIPPLDGGHVAQAFMPYRQREKFDAYARYAPFLVLAMMMIPQLRVVFTEPAVWCTRHLYSGLGSIVGI